MKNNIAIALVLIAICSIQKIVGQQTVGLFSQTIDSKDGYVLFAPIHSDTTYLIDKCGKQIHQWHSNRTPGLSVYLLPNGELLRTASIPNATITGNGAAGGRIERLGWNSNVIWSFILSDSVETQNHDVCPLPNGNILVAMWSNYMPSQAITAGRDPAILGTAFWSAKLIELQPIGTNSANIVWQWNLWEHLIQDFDSTKTNYGVVADHPELLNLNFNGTNAATSVDWIHLNAVTFNEDLDQIMISSHNLSEIYIIDHSTTTSEAATHSGGVHNKGGDFLYRWGNPAAYNRGTTADRKLFLQHNPTWVPTGYPNANKIMIFNNGVNRPGGNASSVDIISPPVDSAGNYSLLAGMAYAPTALDWTYQAAVPSSFFAQSMGGAQQLSNGNIIICEATTGDFFEIDSLGNTVWEYINPVETSGPAVQTTTVSTNQSFRCVYYPLDYSGFAGHTLTPGNPIEINPLPSTCSMNTATNIADINILYDENISVINPFGQSLILFSNKEIKNLNIVLCSVTGSVVCKWNNIAVAKNGQIDLPVNSALSEGIYFIHYFNDGIQGNKKVVKIPNH